MLIILDESILPLLINPSSAAIDNIDSILTCHFKRLHFVYCTPKTIKKILSFENLDLNKRQRTSFEQLLSHCRVSKDILDKVSHRIIISGHPTEKTQHDITVGTVWNYSINEDLSWLIQPTNIYGEHLSDVHFMESSAIYYAMKIKLNQNNIRIKKDMTGGCGNVFSIVSGKAREKQPSAFAIVIDSDKTFPEKKPTINYEECVQAASKIAPPHLIHLLDEREMENIIPLELLEAAFSESSDSPLPWKKIDQLAGFNREHPEHYKYIDIKNGECETTINNSKHHCVRFFSHIKRGETCNSHKESACLCLTPGLGDKTLEKINNYISRVSSHKLSEMKFHKNKNGWDSIGKLILSLSLCNGNRLT